MRRPVFVTALVLCALMVPGRASGQSPADGASRWELGAGIGLGANEPASAFGHCGQSSRAELSVRGSYSLRPWLRVGFTAGAHSELGEECLVLHDFAVPATRKEYPDEIRGSAAYATTGVRLVVTPYPWSEGVRPLFIAGVGRIWGKDLHYPELGLGAGLPIGGVRLRFEALGRWMSVPYDLVRVGGNVETGVIELSRTRLDEEHFPVLFRLGVSWRP